MDSTSESDGGIIASLFPNKVAVATSREEGVLEKLYKEEQSLISHAIDKRQKDFTAGRLCAKSALAELGVEHFPILMDSKGAPVWPLGVAGSISHAKACCAAVVSIVQKGESIGLDIEEVSRIKESVWDYAFGPIEIEWLKDHSEQSQKFASVMFAAKEAFYKAQYPLTHHWLGFKDVVVSVDPGSQGFAVELLKDLERWEKGTVFKGRFDFFDIYTAAGVFIES